MKDQIDIPITFILSTGRTGTQFFSNYLTESCSQILCLHEPRPSRRFKWYSNFYLINKIRPDFIARQYLRKRKSILSRSDFSHYAESSNFIFGCIPAIATVVPDISVIHIVRNPVSYIQSHLNKGFWSGIKGFTAKNIPGWLEFIDPEIKHSGDPVLILAARWIYVNSVINAYHEKYPSLFLRFEDIFGKDRDAGIKSLDTVRDFLECPPLDHSEQSLWLEKSANRSKKQRAEKYVFTDKHREFLREKGTGLLEQYNYEI